MNRAHNTGIFGMDHLELDGRVTECNCKVYKGWGRLTLSATLSFLCSP